MRTSASCRGSSSELLSFVYVETSVSLYAALRHPHVAGCNARHATRSNISCTIYQQVDCGCHNTCMVAQCCYKQLLLDSRMLMLLLPGATVMKQIWNKTKLITIV